MDENPKKLVEFHLDFALMAENYVFMCLSLKKRTKEKKKLKVTGGEGTNLLKKMKSKVGSEDKEKKAINAWQNLA